MNGPLKFLTARKICSCSLQNSNHRKCVGGGGGGGGRKEWERSGVGRCFVLVFARIGPCDLIEYKKVAFFKLLFVYLRNLGVLKNSFKCAFYMESEFVGF